MPASAKIEVMQHIRGTAILPDGADLSDGQLLEEYVRRRDKAAIAALIQRHGQMVWGVSRRILRNPHDAEDAFQATFLVLVRRADSIGSRELVANWLYGVARQTALKARAMKAKRRNREMQVSEIPEPIVESSRTWDDIQPVLDEEISRLPEKYRSVIVLCDLEGKTRKDAAHQLAVPEGTVAGWLARARAMLAKRLARRGIALSGAALATLLESDAVKAGVPSMAIAETISAASDFAANGGAQGKVSIAVVVLAEEVLKSMRTGKVKLTVSILLVASIAALTCGILAGQQTAIPPNDVAKKPQARQAEPANPELAKLQGSWRLVAMESNGLTFTEGRREVKDTRLTIDQSSMKLRYSLLSEITPPEEKEATANLTLNAEKSPKQLVITWQDSPWSQQKAFVQPAIYRIEGDTLRICMSLPGEEKQDTPTDFYAKYDSRRCIWTFRRGESADKPTAKTRPPAPANPRKPIGNPDELAKSDVAKLQGTWRQIASEGDGLIISEGRPEICDNKLVVEGNLYKLTFASKTSFTGDTLKFLNKEMSEMAGTFSLNAGQIPRVIELKMNESPVNGMKDVLQKAIYSLDGDYFKICMSQSDDRQSLPDDFSVGTNTKRMLWIFRREPSGKPSAQPDKPSR
jgi:RNA polymerase sigma factor (sigma-70 family)